MNDMNLYLPLLLGGGSNLKFSDPTSSSWWFTQWFGVVFCDPERD